jgi:hypothetical protein
MPRASFKILCKSKILSVKRLSADIMAHSASGEKQNEPWRFSFVGWSSSKELQRREMRTDEYWLTRKHHRYKQLHVGRYWAPHGYWMALLCHM